MSQDLTNPNTVIRFCDITWQTLRESAARTHRWGALSIAEAEGVGVLDGFATTADAYRQLLAARRSQKRLRAIFTPLTPRI